MNSIRYTAFLLCFSFLVYGGELRELWERAFQSNPGIQAGRQRVEQSRLKHSEIEEFLDPTVYAGGGRTQRHRALPLSASSYRSLADNMWSAEAGVQVPVKGGAYLNAGGALRQTIESRDYDERLFQHLVGVQLSVPLLKDRGFALLGYRKSIAVAEHAQSMSELLAQCQALSHDIELAYIDAMELKLNAGIKRLAVQRFEKFREEAKMLAEMKTVAQYEVSTTTIELQIGKDDCEIAENQFRLALKKLELLIGDGKPVTLKEAPQSLEVTALSLPPLQKCDLEAALTSRGDAAALRESQKAAELTLQQQQEEDKDEIFLNAGLTYQGEGKDYPTQDHRRLSDQHWGGEVTLVWTRPLWKQGGEARQARFRARIRELGASYEARRLEIESLMSQASLAITSAELRLELTRQGIKAAEDTVRAEQERFKNGEGSSKAVLDAQKNLNAILLRLTAAYAALLRARADYTYATGYHFRTSGAGI